MNQFHESKETAGVSRPEPTEIAPYLAPTKLKRINNDHANKNTKTDMWHNPTPT